MLAIKWRWPAAVDGTAMVMGSMAPDWSYALHGTPLAFDAHGGGAWWCSASRRRWWRRRSCAGWRRCSSAMSLAPRCCRCGSRGCWVSVAPAGRVPGERTGRRPHPRGWYLFTHDGSWGPRHIAWLRSTAVEVAGHSQTWAGMLQYASHVGGALVSVYLLSRIPPIGLAAAVVRRRCRGRRRTPAAGDGPLLDGRRRRPVGRDGMGGGGRAGAPRADHPRQPGRGGGTGCGIGRLRPGAAAGHCARADHVARSAGRPDTRPAPKNEWDDEERADEARTRHPTLDRRGVRRRPRRGGRARVVRPEAGASSTAPAYDRVSRHPRRGGPGPGPAGPPGTNPGVPGRLRRHRPLPGPGRHQHWFPESLFRWTPTDDRLHLTVGTALVVLGACPRSRPAG